MVIESRIQTFLALIRNRDALLPFLGPERKSSSIRGFSETTG
jgi:hypothetical protein